MTKRTFTEAEKRRRAEYSRRWKETHRDSVRERAKISYQRDREKKLAYMKARRDAGLTPRVDTDTGALAEVDVAMTFAEIAEELGITRARVGQIVAKALRKLRERDPNLAELLR